MHHFKPHKFQPLGATSPKKYFESFGAGPQNKKPEETMIDESIFNYRSQNPYELPSELVSANNSYSEV